MGFIGLRVKGYLFRVQFRVYRVKGYLFRLRVKALGTVGAWVFGFRSFWLVGLGFRKCKQGGLLVLFRV